MAKILYFTDLHIKGKTPESRIGDYQADLLKKVHEIVTIANAHDAVAVCGGDFFDAHDISVHVGDRFIEAFSELKHGLYTTLGSHDVQGYNYDLKTTTVSHFFKHCQWFKPLISLELGNFIFDGYNHTKGLENKVLTEGLYHKHTGKKTVAIPHMMFIDVKSGFFDCVPFKTLKTNYDYIFTSHNHKPYGIIKHKKTTFISIGSLGRCSVDDKHNPQVLLFDTDTGEHEKIELKCAISYAELFKWEEIQANKEIDAKLKEFIAKIQSTTLQSLKIEDIVKQVALEQKVDDSVVDEIMGRIGA